MDDNYKTPLIISAVEMAVRNLDLPDGAVFHSDRGSNYTSAEFARELAALGIRQSVGRTGICYDNAFRFLADAMIAGDVDLLVMSFSAPTPQQTWYYRKASTDAFRASYRHGASNMARLLGIPAIQVNKCGAWKSELPTPFPAQDSKFDGQSEIADGSGEIVAELADQEAALVAAVVLDPSRKKRALPVEATRHGRWIAPVPADFRLFWIVELFGRRSYERSRRRRERARAIGNRLPQTSQAAT